MQMLPLVIAVIVIGITIFYFMRGKSAGSVGSSPNASFAIPGYEHLCAGKIAEAHGLTLERGDPNFNLAYHNQIGLHASKDVDIFIRGTAHGVPVEMLMKRKVERKERMLDALATYSTECRISALTQASFGRFEVTLREETEHYGIKPYFRDAIPERRFGVPELDAKLRIVADDPTIATRLAPFIGAVLAAGYVHVVGEPGRVSFDMAHCHAKTGAKTYNERTGATERGAGMEMMGAAYGFTAHAPLLEMLTAIARDLDAAKRAA